MRFIDIGVNLMSQSFDRDREQVLEAAVLAGVSPLIITGNDLKSSADALAFAKTHAGRCYATAGVHPHNAKTWESAAPARLRELAAGEALAAIGECGLDYNRNFSPPSSQRKCFEDQLALAAELGRPVFLHERDAFGDFFAILSKYRSGLPGAVVHCFTGGMKELEVYLEMDCHIGITGWICDERRGKSLIPLLKHIPSDRLLLETDAPYLMPRSLRHNGRNEPRFLPHIAGFIADALGKEIQTLACETYTNTIRFFSLPMVSPSP